MFTHGIPYWEIYLKLTADYIHIFTIMYTVVVTHAYVHMVNTLHPPSSNDIIRQLLLYGMCLLTLYTRYNFHSIF